MRNLRKINREFGYRCGDSVMTACAVRIGSCLRPSDIMVRLAGSQFAIMLPSLIGDGQALLAANRIDEVLHQPISVDHNFRSTISARAIRRLPISKICP